MGLAGEGRVGDVQSPVGQLFRCWLPAFPSLLFTPAMRETGELWGGEMVPVPRCTVFPEGQKGAEIKKCSFPCLWLHRNCHRALAVQS